MARSRNIKPGFFKNEILAEMLVETRLLFIGLWCLADREGRLDDRPRRIKAELFPYDNFDIDFCLSQLSSGGFLIRYEVDSVKYMQIINFTKHQMPHHKEVASEIPAPPGCDQITKHPYDVSPEERAAIFERDGSQCLRCGATESLSLDHIKALASGGDNSTNNLQTLCKSCNSSKGNTTKDYRKINVNSTLGQRSGNDGDSCPPDSLIPDSLNLIPDSKDAPPAEEAHSAPDDLASVIFGSCETILGPKGRALVGQARKRVGEQKVLEVLAHISGAKPQISDPVPYFVRATSPKERGVCL